MAHGLTDLVAPLTVFGLGHNRGNRGVRDVAPVVIDKSINQLGQSNIPTAGLGHNWGKGGI